MTTGVVIVTYNSKKTVQACIESAMHVSVTEVVVVDSNSQDSTVAMLSKWPVKSIVLGKNNGFAFAANRGVELLNTDYVLFLNPDAVLNEGVLDSLVAVMSGDEKIGIVGAGLVDEYGIPEKYGFGNTVTPFEGIVRQFRSPARIRDISSVGWVSGGAMLVRRKVFEGIGGFDEGYFLYWEDVDLCRRVKNAGFSIRIQPSARVMHKRGASSLDSRKKTELYDASANRYFQKYYPPMLCHLYRIARLLYRIFRPLAQ